MLTLAAIRTELVKSLRRPRTYVAYGILALIPIIMAVAIDLNPPSATGDGRLLYLASQTGLLLPGFALRVTSAFLLVIVVALFGGDAIAGEAQTGTLRYLLVRPVGRTHLLLAKLVTVVAFVIMAVLIVAVVSYVEGRLLLGKSTTTGGTVSLSGSTLTPHQLAGRTALALAYVIVCMLGVAAIALFFSTLTSSSVGAALGTVGVLIASTVLLGLDAAQSLQPFLPTRYWLSFVDLFRDPILWDGVVRGLLVQLAYLLVFSLAAWANFTSKDIAD